MKTLIPSFLKPNDLIAITAPSGAVFDQRGLARAVARLRFSGFRVRICPSCYLTEAATAKADHVKARELTALFEDPAVNGILCARGGYGTIRLLRYLPFERIRANPKLLIGYSDITAIHLCLNQLSGMATCHGAMAVTELGREVPDKTTVVSLKQRFTTPGFRRYPCHHLINGTAFGRILGGNLSTVASLCGSPYALDGHDKIILLEEVNEPPYKIDRMLWQLRLSGVFDHCAGVILGAFTDNKEDDLSQHERREVIRSFFDTAVFPVVRIGQIGHTAPNISILLGTPAWICHDAVIL